MVTRLALILLLALPAFAKSLHWSAIDVQARLDRDGRLHVVERQSIVFDGDWNGGERDFNLRPRQDLELHRLIRVEDGREIPLEWGSLDVVDRYDFATPGVLRWRRRMPEDPPFANRELTYVLDYTYSNILDADFALSHDFGLPVREGNIERFTLRVDFDPVWNTPPVVETRANLAPGAGVVVNRKLHYSGEGWPAGVHRQQPWWVGVAILLLFGACAWMLIRAFHRGEWRKGRFEPLHVEVDPGLLELKAEVAGAVWDAGVGAPEVAATIARMAQEGKLTTRVEGTTLHMHLDVPRASLDGYEQELVEALFSKGEHDTDTDRIRSRYKSRGFNPTSIIRPGIEAELARTIPDWSQKRKRNVPRLVGMMLGALLFLIGAAMVGEDESGVAAGAVMTGLILGGIAAIVAHFKSRAVTDFVPAFVAPAILLVFPVLSYATTALNAGSLHVGPLVLAAVALWLLAWLRLVLELLKIPDSAMLIASRKRISGTRQFFLRELQSPNPAMRDEWFPYVLAFGLGAHAEQWFRSFGGVSSSSSHATSSSTGSSSSSSTSSSSSWTGGGGAFGGAGATGSWAIAAGAMAAGVASPASSSGGGSSGGGGGGSSSGGGGGGGW